ncbi:hypothetical protein BDV96DRAFT_666466 [Lophiotrema nucula]|uniref:Uncharacterized protein n=1 Tax=Lophiotrema nucula TaxID=690887 RepID=A0A6A5YWP0_9PLEO|nr:hypothetical protein BDV96DRAFT_666466 [Lophiotrema nucula]
MKPTSALLSFACLLITVSSATAPPPGQTFYLKVVGGNTLTSGAVLRDNNTYDLGVTSPPYFDSLPYGDHPSPISVATDSSGELIVSPTNPHPGPISGRLALVSNSSGDWTLSKAFPQPGGIWNAGPDREDATVKTVGWEFRDATWGGGATVLRWADASSSGRWIAVKKDVQLFEGAPYVRWVLHWVEVRPDTWAALGEYRVVDLEISSTP